VKSPLGCHRHRAEVPRHPNQWDLARVHLTGQHGLDELHDIAAVVAEGIVDLGTGAEVKN